MNGLYVIISFTIYYFIIFTSYWVTFYKFYHHFENTSNSVYDKSCMIISKNKVSKLKI